MDERDESMKKKLQKIPNSTWAKLIRIQELKESWNMMTIINECIDLGANYMIKKLTKKEASPKSPEEAPEENITPEEEKRLIEIAKTPWVGKDF